MNTFETKLLHVQKLYSQAIEIAQKELSADDKLMIKLKDSLARCTNHTFHIAVIAMTKSGKSTFLNALLGNEFLTVSNKPETAVPVRICHSLEYPNGLLADNENKVAQGAAEIHEYIKYVNEDKREQVNKKESHLKLYAPLHAFKDVTIENVKFEIFDTPGFGEMGEAGKKIRSENYERLDEIGVVLYLLDYTKLNFEDEDNVLDEIFKRRKDLPDALKERLFFVITKIDISAADSRYNDSIEKTKAHIYEKLLKKIPNLKRDSIFAISANNAILARMILNGVASKEAVTDFARRVFGLAFEGKSVEDCLPHAQFFLEKHSYLPNLEEKILTSIYDNREKILFDSLISELERYIKELQNKLSTAEGALAADKKKLDEIENDINQSKKKSEKLKKKEQEHIDEVTGLIDGELTSLEKRLIGYAKGQTKLLKKISRRDSPSEIKETIEEVHGSISSVLQENTTEFVEEIKSRLSDLQSKLFNEFAKLTRQEAENFEKSLGRKLNVELYPGTISLKVPSSKEILDNANQMIQRFIESKEVSKSYTKRIGSMCNPWPRYETRYETSTEYDVNEKAILDFWMDVIRQLNDTFKSISGKFIENDMKRQLLKVEDTFNQFVDQYLEIIQRERKSKVKGGAEYIERRLIEIRQSYAKVNNIFKGIENYRNLKG